MNKLRIGLALGLSLGLLASTVTVVDAREVAVVTAFGKPVRTLTDPGLSFRAPWPIHQVVRFDSRIRLLQVSPQELLTRDKKNLAVEAFVAWRVQDPELYLEAVGSTEVAELQLSDLALSRIAAGLGQRDFSELVSDVAGVHHHQPRGEGPQGGHHGQSGEQLVHGPSSSGAATGLSGPTITRSSGPSAASPASSCLSSRKSSGSWR